MAALREAGRLGAWRLLGAPVPPGPGGVAAPRHGARARARSPGSLPTPRSACACSPSPRGARPSRRGWIGSRSRRPGASRSGSARRDAPRLVARLADVRGRSAAYGILQCMPELTVAWARALAGAVRGAAASRPSSPELAPAPAAGDRRRRRRAGRSPGAGGRRDPEGAPGGAGRRTRPKPDWCVTLAHRAPSPGAAGAGKHRSPDRVREEADRADQVRVRHRRGRVIPGQGAGGRLHRLSPGSPRLPRHAPEDGSLHQRRCGDHEPLPARRGLRHRRRRRDRSRPGPLRAVHPRADDAGPQRHDRARSTTRSSRASAAATTSGAPSR